MKLFVAEVKEEEATEGLALWISSDAAESSRMATFQFRFKSSLSLDKSVVFDCSWAQSSSGAGLANEPSLPSSFGLSQP